MSEGMTDPKGMRMVYVPTGKFLMGSTERQVEEAYQQAKKENRDADKEWFTPEIPQHEQVIQTAFWLDLLPVTNASYAHFMREGGYSTRGFWTGAGWKWLEDNKQSGPKDYPDVSSTPDQPRVGVTWFKPTLTANGEVGGCPLRRNGNGRRVALRVGFIRGVTISCRTMRFGKKRAEGERLR